MQGLCFRRLPPLQENVVPSPASCPSLQEGIRMPCARCKDLKEHLKRLLQQSDSRRRPAVMEMMRQRSRNLWLRICEYNIKCLHPLLHNDSNCDVAMRIISCSFVIYRVLMPFSICIIRIN